ncbi:MAG: hypothetical protein ABL952_02760 [Pyrinomonadaceae bacterium]
MHLPDPDKANYTKFEEIVNSRISEEDYDFDYVFFPTTLTLPRFKSIETPVDFSNATFHRGLIALDIKFQTFCSFRDAIFWGEAEFSGSKFNEFYFYGTEFKALADFSRTRFKSFAHFWRIVFHNGADFSGARFYKDAHFDDIQAINPDPLKFSLHPFSNPNLDFSQAVFRKRFSLSHSHVHGAHFFFTKFHQEAGFSCTEIRGKWAFPQADFAGVADFTAIEVVEGSELIFKSAIFRDYLIFDNSDFFQFHSFEKSVVDLSDAVLEKPERSKFHAVVLQPHWFLGVDCRKVVFNSIHWFGCNGGAKAVQAELDAIDPILGPSRLIVTYRQLAENYETTRRFEMASRFRRAGFETQRLNRKRLFNEWWSEEYKCSEIFKDFGVKIRELPFDLAHFLYRFSSYYGEHSSRAAFILLLIIGTFGIFYSTSFAQFLADKPIDLSLVEGFSYSVRVMLLQRLDPLPASDFTKLMVAVESILAPTQIALLALALRRKFMT